MLFLQTLGVDPSSFGQGSRLGDSINHPGRFPAHRIDHDMCMRDGCDPRTVTTSSCPILLQQARERTVVAGRGSKVFCQRPIHMQGQ